MVVLCTESSHSRGMGHLYRMLVYSDYLASRGIDHIFLINDDAPAIEILKGRGKSFLTADYSDESATRIGELAKDISPGVWINDKYETSMALAEAVKNAGIRLAVIDDRGDGAALSDYHFVGMMFDIRDDELKGRRVFRGLEYNILNPEIKKYRRLHGRADRILVTLGGSDTYGVTVKAVKCLSHLDIAADIVTGASFRHMKELREVTEGDDRYRLLGQVPSLVKTLSEYDAAVTGGGVTALEACALGVPSVIIANEPHEIYTAKYLESLGVARFAGYYEDIREECFSLAAGEAERMSRAALKLPEPCACERITDYVFNG